jgi:probable phosphoglycerate mutase
MAAATLVIVRHGETAWNAERRVQGQLDIPLNALGLEQARAVGAALARERVDAI